MTLKGPLANFYFSFLGQIGVTRENQRNETSILYLDGRENSGDHQHYFNLPYLDVLCFPAVVVHSSAVLCGSVVRSSCPNRRLDKSVKVSSGGNSKLQNLLYTFGSGLLKKDF